MSFKMYRVISIFLLILINQISPSQTSDSTSFKINTRFSFYSFEKSGEILLQAPKNFGYSNLDVIISVNNTRIGSWKGKPGKRPVRIPFTIDQEPSCYKIIADISVSGSKIKFKAEADLYILEYKANEVKTDRLTGGLIVSRKPFFPFGFYCYSPVYPSLPEEEVVKGFNMISPYQKILPETLKERKAYMDRCAQLGMRVHYNLLSVSGGGGGVSSKIEGLTYSEKMQRLLNEIDTFQDHPALLAWYISDEPAGYRIVPDSLIKIYNIIKKKDPWHPVSMVFNAPFLSSLKYADALDIVMADPYPVPDSPVTITGDAAGSLTEEFRGRKSVWIVPQTFGGGEWWGREPSLQEVRAMTYQSIINGARGIQYFVRQGLNLFPKSTATWGECGRMAVEIAEITPWLLSDEEPIAVRSGSQNIMVTSALHDGQLLVIAANKLNSPQHADFLISTTFSGKGLLLFENRNVQVSGGYFSDNLSALGTQVYLISLKPRKEKTKSWSDNLIKDPGFEDISSPGVPASCYARNGGDRGATYFLDSREHIEGNHSVRLVTPRENGSAKLRFFPVKVLNGKSYYLSVWAKAEKGMDQLIENMEKETGYFELGLGDSGTQRFLLTGDWQEFVTIVTIPFNTDQPPGTNVTLQMPSAGTAWFDMLQVAPVFEIKRCINPDLAINGFE
jgi:hypothetical protein